MVGRLPRLSRLSFQDHDILGREVNTRGYNFNLSALLLVVHRQCTQLADHQPQASKHAPKLGLIDVLVALQAFGLPEPLPQEDRFSDVAGIVA